MTTTPHKDELQRRIKEPLWHERDPIGIQALLRAQNQCGSCVHDVCHLELGGASFQDVFACLWSHESSTRGFKEIVSEQSSLPDGSSKSVRKSGEGLANRNASVSAIRGAV
jgi:hypothetical protein